MHTYVCVKKGELIALSRAVSFSILDDWEAITGRHFNRTSIPQPRVDFGHLAGLA